MRLFFELTKRSFNRQLSYRAATIAGLVTNFFFGLLRAAVLVALYGERQEVAGIDIPMAITYTALTQAVIGYLSLFRWHNLMQSVYSGEVASDLLKPMNYFSFWLAQDMGRAIASFITRSLTVMVAYAIFVGITTPKTLNQWVAVGLALIFSWLLSFSWRFLVNLAAFWTPNAVGIARFSFIAAWFLSGFIMPLRFFPDWAVRIFYLTPFPHMINALIEIYLGVLSVPEILRTFTGQIIWIVVLGLISHIVLRAGIRRLEILGG